MIVDEIVCTVASDLAGVPAEYIGPEGKVTEEGLGYVAAIAQAVASPDEFVAELGKYGVTLSDEQRARIARLWTVERLEDDELDNASGGSTMIGGKSYSDDPEGYLIVTCSNSCVHFHSDNPADRKCKNCGHGSGPGVPMYCYARTRYNDPFNTEIGGSF